MFLYLQLEPVERGSSYCKRMLFWGHTYQMPQVHAIGTLGSVLCRPMQQPTEPCSIVEPLTSTTRQCHALQYCFCGPQIWGPSHSVKLCKAIHCIPASHHDGGGDEEVQVNC